MAKLIKRKSLNIKAKFKKAQSNQTEQLRLNKEEEINEKYHKLMSSPLKPIIFPFYVENPIIRTKAAFYESKTFDQGITMLRQALRGTLFNDTQFKAYYNRKFTIDEILHSIENHKLAKSPDYKPFDKKFLRVHLSQFLYNPYASSIGKSFLIYWMNNDPIPIAPIAQDRYSGVTAELIALFGWNQFVHEELSCIIKGVAHFESLLRKDFTISPVHRNTPELHAKILHEILVELFSFVGVDVQPKNLVSPKFESWIVKGLKESQYTV